MSGFFNVVAGIGDGLARTAVGVPGALTGGILSVAGAGLSTVGLTNAGDKVSRAGDNVVAGSMDLLRGSAGEVRERNAAFKAFAAYSNGAGEGAYMAHTEVLKLVIDHPELYIGLEGIVGTTTAIQERAARLLLEEYGSGGPGVDGGGGGVVEWRGFYKLWCDIFEDGDGRLRFYHNQIFTHYDVEGCGSLSEPQVARLLDDLYFSEDSAFAGDKRMPPRTELLPALMRQAAGDGAPAPGRLTLEQLVPLFTGDFNTTPGPEAV